MSLDTAPGPASEGTPDSVLDVIDRYGDAQPRPTSRQEDIGPFTLFVATGAFGYYARPRLGCTTVLGQHGTVADVEAVRERQRQLGVTERFEWIADVVPALEGLMEKAGLAVEHHPCLILSSPVDIAPPAGISLRFLTPADPDWAPAVAAVDLGFGDSGTAVGPAGASDRDALVATMASSEPASRWLGYFRQLAERDLIRWITAYDETGPVAGGSYHPRTVVTTDGSTVLVAEITGIGTLPSSRRRGIGGAVVAALVADARECGVELIWMGAVSDDIARVYERVGFRRIATACEASLGRP